MQFSHNFHYICHDIFHARVLTCFHARVLRTCFRTCGWLDNLSALPGGSIRLKQRIMFDCFPLSIFVDKRLLRTYEIKKNLTWNPTCETPRQNNFFFTFPFCRPCRRKTLQLLMCRSLRTHVCGDLGRVHNKLFSVMSLRSQIRCLLVVPTTWRFA